MADSLDAGEEAQPSPLALQRILIQMGLDGG